MKSALHVMLTTRKGIIVFIAHVTMLDATAAYPNHIGHSMCLKNSILFPRLDCAPSPDTRHHDCQWMAETLTLYYYSGGRPGQTPSPDRRYAFYDR